MVSKLSRRQRSRLSPAPCPAKPMPAPAAESVFVPDENTSRVHYRGDLRGFDRDQVYGPDRFRAYYRAGAAECDPLTDRTTIYLRPIMRERAR